MTTLITSNDEINDIIKILKSLENSGSLLKGFAETIQNEVKEKKRRVSYYVIRHITCKFIRKSFNW